MAKPTKKDIMAEKLHTRLNSIAHPDDGYIRSNYDAWSEARKALACELLAFLQMIEND